MHNLSKEEISWFKKLEELLASCPSDRIAAFTNVDPTILFYDKNVLDDYEKSLHMRDESSIIENVVRINQLIEYGWSTEYWAGTIGHTPGPWKVNTVISPRILSHSETMNIYVYAPSFSQAAICDRIVDPITQEPSEANAHLIAAAPDLLDELENCADLLNLAFPDVSVDSCIGVALTKARAAITKATGQPCHM